MQFTSIIAVALVALGVSAQYSGPNGAHYCVGVAISYEYKNSRCANSYSDMANSGSDTVALYDTTCSCPNGPADNPYTGASCIDLIRYEGRHQCGTNGS